MCRTALRSCHGVHGASRKRGAPLCHRMPIGSDHALVHLTRFVTMSVHRTPVLHRLPLTHSSHSRYSSSPYICRRLPSPAASACLRCSTPLAPAHGKKLHTDMLHARHYDGRTSTHHNRYFLLISDLVPVCPHGLLRQAAVKAIRNVMGDAASMVACAGPSHLLIKRLTVLIGSVPPQVAQPSSPRASPSLGARLA